MRRLPTGAQRRSLPRSAAMLLALLSGCVGSVEDEKRFGDGTYCPPDVDIERLIAQRCGSSICHGATMGEPAGGLDLESPGVGERLVGVPAQECEGLLRIDPADPDSSFLLEKVEGPREGCGDPMPLVGRLTRTEIDCFTLWARDLALGGQGVGEGGAGTFALADGGTP